MIAVFIDFSAYAQTNKVLNLDGDGDYVSVEEDPSLVFGTGDFSVEFWFSLNTLAPSHQNIIGNREIDHANSWWFGIFSNGGTNYHNGCNNIARSEAGEIATCTWYHIALVRDSGTVTTYKNGIPIASGLDTCDLISATEDLEIGRTGVHGEYVNGFIDEVCIWNVVRTQEQIQATMNTTLSGTEAGLVAYWNFDNGTANDLTANHNDGILYGDAKIVGQLFVSPSGSDANDGSEEHPFRTIQYAIYQSGRGNIITALPGTYEENITLVSDLVLQGSGDDQTIITASSGDVITANDVHNVTLSVFTIDGQGTADSGFLCGGSTSEMKIQNNTITNAKWGIYCIDSSAPSIEKNMVVQNVEVGVYCINLSSPKIIDNLIEDNGHGISCRDTSIVRIEQNYVRKNRYNGALLINILDILVQQGVRMLSTEKLGHIRNCYSKLNYCNNLSRNRVSTQFLYSRSVFSQLSAQKCPVC